jgi:hypothetical protein
MRATIAWMESHKAATITIVGVVVVVVAMAGTSRSTVAPQATSQAGVASSNSLSAADAAAQFKDLMDTGEKAELVSSYRGRATDFATPGP